MSRKSAQRNDSRLPAPDSAAPGCWKQRKTLEQVKSALQRYADQGRKGDGQFYFCQDCQAYHTTSRSNAKARFPNPYKRPSPGDSRNRRWRL